MQDKLDAILEKLDQLNERLEALEERIYEWENSAMVEREQILSEVQGVTPLLTDICTFQRLDFPDFESENLIFLHKNAMRTASFVDSVARSTGVNNTVGQHFSPEVLRWIIAQGKNIVVDGGIFAVSPEYEQIVCEAIARKLACFVVVTRDVDAVPQSLRDQMRVVE